MPTIIKANQVVETESFRLHYFPDISFECAYPDENAKEICESFENIEFVSTGQESDSASGVTYAKRAHGNAAGLMSSNDAPHYEAEFQKGRDEGFKAGIQQAQTKLANLSQIAMQLELFKQELYQRAEKDVVELALAVCKKILGQEVTTNPEVILAVIQTACQRVTDNTDITIRINPADLDTVKQADARLATYFENSNTVTYAADESIEQGGCIIESNFGEIDARLDQQFEAVASALRSSQSRNE